MLGADVAKIDGDSGDTTTDIATQTTTRLLGEGVDAIVGAASSGVSFTVIDQITGAGVVHFSPANTSPDFTDYDDNGLYFRTAPSDVLQGRVLGDLLVRDGCLAPAAIVLDDPYGTGLADNFTRSLEAGGGQLATDPIKYPEGTDNFSAQVTQVADANPECVVLIGFAETAQIITEMLAQGLSSDRDRPSTSSTATSPTTATTCPRAPSRAARARSRLQRRRRSSRPGSSRWTRR